MSVTPETLVVELQKSYASLLCTLALLDREEIEHGRMTNEWTPKALIAHVAFWDDVQTRRMQAALGGGSAVIGFVPPAATNDERAATDTDRPLDVVLSAADAARERLVRFTAGLSAEQLVHPLPEGNVSLVLRDRIAHMVRHTDVHDRELWSYCGSMRRWTRSRLRAFLVQQEENLMASIGGLSEEVLSSVTVDGAWTIRDSLVHILAWREYSYLVVRHWPAIDDAMISAWHAAEGVDVCNAELHRARAALNMIDVADGLTTYHRRLLKLFDRATDADLASIGTYGWGDQGALSAFFFGLAHHEMEHAAKIWEFRVGKLTE